MLDLNKLRIAGSALLLCASGCAEVASDSDVDSATPDLPADAGGWSPADAGPFGNADAGVLVGADASLFDAGDGGATPVVGDASTPQDAALDGSAPAPTTPAPKPKCMKKDSQLIVIGDSYINWTSHTFPADIKRESGQSWRMEAQGGTSLGSGGLGSIPQQFYDSIARDRDAHTVLMTGGGNDVLVPDLTNAFFFECTSTGSSKKANCQKIVSTAISTAVTLRGKMVDAGIRDLVYFFYPHVPANTILSGDKPAEILDYALPMVRQFCEGSEQATGGKLRCTFIDLIPLFAGHNDWYNGDIHENEKGSAAMAKEIWGVMTGKCIGQKGPKDCCE